jgi:dTDP-4-amino-4,6-dideoxygalactose transaminase
MLRDWGQKTKYAHVLKGFNARMDALQGAVLRVKLRHLEAWTESRRERARQYGELLAGCEPIGLPVECSDRRHVYHLYVARVVDREGFRGFLGDQDVGTGIHYPTPVHLLEGYADLGYREGEFPEAERAAAEVVSLPMYPELTSDHVVTVAGAIEEWAAR